MKTANWILFFAIAAVAIGLAPQNAMAQNDEASIKQRMIERVASVDALKLSGSVGENNKGFLEQRAMLNPAQTKIMNDENGDRKALYTILANRLGLSVAVVGQGRAESIREKSAPGIWIQQPSGQWSKK
jgi:uncharacterized protein YdbL (DUF1318 family)